MRKLLLFAFCIITAGTACADTITFNLDASLAGATPQGTPPWLQAAITDLGPNRVELKMMAVDLTSTEYVEDWRFNIDPALGLSSTGCVGRVGGDLICPDGLTISHQSGPGAEIITPSSSGLDFTFEVDPQDFFPAGAASVYVMSRPAGVSARDFDVIRTLGGTAGAFHTLARVNGIGDPNEQGNNLVGDAVASPVPEPNPAALALLGLAACAAGAGHHRVGERRARLPFSLR